MISGRPRQGGPNSPVSNCFRESKAGWKVRLSANPGTLLHLSKFQKGAGTQEPCRKALYLNKMVFRHRGSQGNVFSLLVST